MSKIKMFEQYHNTRTNFDIIEFPSILGDVDMYPEKMEHITFELLKEKTDKFVGKGFYEKVYEKSKIIYDKLFLINQKIDLLEGLAENRFETILKKYNKEISLSPVLSSKSKGNVAYSGFRHFGENLNLKSIFCNILKDFIWGTLSNSLHKDIRTSSEAFMVNDEKWNVLNIPKNKELYNGSVDNGLIEYIEGFDINKYFHTSILFRLYQWDFKNLKLVDVSECDKIFDEFFKLMKKVLKIDLEVIPTTSHKYHKVISDYEIIILVK